jgi:hypothetical protein
MAMASALQWHVMINIPYFDLVSLKRKDFFCNYRHENLFYNASSGVKKVGERREYEQTVRDVNNPPSANISYTTSITYFIQYLRAQLTYTHAYIHISDYMDTYMHILTLSHL